MIGNTYLLSQTIILFFAVIKLILLLVIYNIWKVVSKECYYRYSVKVVLYPILKSINLISWSFKRFLKCSNLLCEMFFVRLSAGISRVRRYNTWKEPLLYSWRSHIFYISTCLSFVEILSLSPTISRIAYWLSQKMVQSWPRSN